MSAEPLPRWVELAACRGRPTSWWFSSDPFEQSVATTVCRGCPVRVECLASALQAEAGQVRVGIFGGLTPDERARQWRG